MSSTIDKVLDVNKQTAVSAAFMEAGRIANNQAAKFISGKAPLVARGYVQTPIGKLVIANMANMAVEKFRPDDRRLNKLTKAMMVSAYQEALAEFDIEEMIENMLSNSSIKKALKSLDQE